MKSVMTAKIIKTMKNKMTNWRFLMENSYEKSDVLNALSSPDFYKGLLICIESDDYSCKGLADVYSVIAKILFNQTLEDTFLEDVYNFVLNKSFPEAVTVDIKANTYLYDFYLELLAVFNDYQSTSQDGSFMSIYPMTMLSKKEVLELDESSEYIAFEKGFKKQYIYEMMKLNYEVKGHSTIEHILGVHHLAMTIARQLRDIGIPIDLGRVSGAAAGHDIGKFGCTPEEKNKIAYYHYYYTDEWFTKLDIKYIKNVAVYHSTWDLELESLSIESLVLIFSDFCVKRSKEKTGHFKMKFLTVEESFKVILNKLDNMDEVKKKRYEKVYQKLNNFSEYLDYLGVNSIIENYVDKPLKPHVKKSVTHEKYSALQQGNVVVDHMKYMAIEKSIELMYKLRHIHSLNEIIQEAKHEKDIQMFRRYLFIFEEYSTYLTPEQKMITLNFLLDYTIHSEEDIRKEASYLIGKLLAEYDENYTKELPVRAQNRFTVETKFNKIKLMIHQFISHEVRMTPIKRLRQVSSFSYIIEKLYESAVDPFKSVLTAMLLECYKENTDEYGDRFLLEILSVIPLDALSVDDKDVLFKHVIALMTSSEEIKIMAYNQLNYLLNYFSDDEKSGYVKLYQLDTMIFETEVEKYLLSSNLTENGETQTIELTKSDMFLSNLKTATPKIIKIAQIEMLYKRALTKGIDEHFYTAMHFCNILKVSAFESVRNKAGHYLVLLFDKLSSEQKNDIVIELIRALEIEGYGFTKYIPNFLGRLIPTLNSKEYHEILDDINYRISNAGINIRVLLLDTVGTMIEKWLEIGCESCLDELLGSLFRGFYSGSKLTAQMAFNVISKDIIGNDNLKLSSRFSIFKKLYKKLHIFLMDNHEFVSLDLFNYTVGLHYIYHFITDYNSAKGDMVFETTTKVAFYSGTFDPFSLGQKSAAVDANSLGFEVYIGISEFQWKRRTQPSLMRKEIIEMSISDQMAIYTFPQSLPLNLRHEDDLKRLKTLFKDQSVYLIIGEEALVHDSLYHDPNNPIFTFPHIIYNRKSMKHTEALKSLIQERIGFMKNDVIIRSLEYKYEMIDVNQIRRNIDNNWDAYDVIDDLATHFIKSHNLYKNEPQFKSVISTNDLCIEIKPLNALENLETLCKKFDIDYDRVKHLKDGTPSLCMDNPLVLERQILLIKNEITDEIIALSIFTEASSEYLFDEIKSLEILKEISEKNHKKVLIIDEVVMKPYVKVHALDQIVLTETLMYAVSNGLEHAVVKCHESNYFSKDIKGVLIRSGFVEYQCTYTNKMLYAVDITQPVVINLDGTTRMKADYRQHDGIRDKIKLVRTNLQHAVVSLYPGSLVLSFDRSMMYNHLIRKITERNSVSINHTGDKGPYMCVPYGDIFKRWLLPNTVTKSFHTERYYNKYVEYYDVKAYPGYLSIEDQSRVLKAFNRPMILVDDLVDKGNRLNSIDQYLKSNDIEIDQVIVGIMSDRGKALFESKGMSLSAAYYIPNIKVWFNEADVYPFIGGDSLVRESSNSSTLLSSVNMMLPFVYPKYIRDVSKEDLYNLSMVCLENAVAILSEVEKVYMFLNNRCLSIENLKEVMITPRVPDVFEHMYYDNNFKPTDFLKNEIERLVKMKDAFKES